MTKKIKLVRKEGGSRVLALTGFIPETWQVVAIEKIATTFMVSENESVTIKIERIK